MVVSGEEWSVYGCEWCGVEYVHMVVSGRGGVCIDVSGGECMGVSWEGWSVHVYEWREIEVYI